MTQQFCSKKIDLNLGKKTVLGILWKIASCAAFAGINGIVRYLTGGSSPPIDHPLPVYVIDFFQNGFALFFLMAWLGIRQKTQRFVIATQHMTLHIFRVMIAILGIGFWYLTLKHMPIAKGVALSFLTPIFTLFCAAFFLQEKLDKYKISCIILSFFASFFIIRPDLMLNESSINLHITMVFPFISALCFALNNILTRKLAAYQESPESLTSYLILLMTPFSLTLALFDWVWPTIHQCAWLLLLGFLTSLAHFSFSKAYSLAEVTFLMPFGFSKFLLSVLIGYFAFSELPPTWQIWFAAIIIFFMGLILNRTPLIKEESYGTA